MVVAALIALLAAIAVPMMTAGGGRSELQRQADQVSALLEQLNEQSLFVGELLAARLEPEGIRPLRYSHEESAFVAMEGRSGGLSVLELPEGLRLEWELEQSERRGANLRDALGSQLAEEDDNGDGRSTNTRDDGGAGSTDSGEETSKEAIPQVFFFPSGEVTPLTLWLRATGAEGAGIELELDSLGRVARPGSGAETDAG
jgi:general secretion pathway protein H